MENRSKISLKSEQELLDDVLYNIVKYEFNFKVSEDRIDIFYHGDEVVTYRLRNIDRIFNNYLNDRFANKKN